MRVGMRKPAQGMKGKRAGRAHQTCNFLCFLCFFFSFPLSGGLWGEGERGALLGSIISVWTRYGHVKAAVASRQRHKYTRLHTQPVALRL